MSAAFELVCLQAQLDFGISCCDRVAICIEVAGEEAPKPLT
jgi:hypothetical protein